MLTEADISKMQALYKKHFGIELDEHAARKKLSRLVKQVELVYRPITTVQLRAMQDEVNKGNEGNKDGSGAFNAIR